ncbi:DnaJ domain-containing protein [Ferrovibrio sp. MS7]|uniref:DnaJ domain-containing protein n=1 Tax=Ferrovibrio plantarum TaxID=3119164 RepID=UPI0031361CE7
MALVLGIGLAALALFLFGGRLFLQADPKALAKGIRIGLGIVLGGLAGFLFLRGRIDMGSLLALAAAAMFGKGRLAGLFGGWFGGPGASSWNRARTGHEATNGGAGGSTAEAAPQSAVETAWLRMRLDHASGTMTGEILQGPLAGRRLDDLDPPGLFALHAALGAEDPNGIALLEAYMERRLGPDWRDQAGEGGAATGDAGSMSREQAYAVLGLQPGSTEGEIRAAHRRLMRTAHPDHGGSTYLAAQINRAKDVLLG